jgi:hypothetical protein
MTRPIGSFWLWQTALQCVLLEFSIPARPLNS